MAYIPLSLPPGIYRNGTQFESKGRYYNCNLVRFYQNTIQPHGGWRIKTTSTMTGKGRAIISWHDNSSNTWTAIGTESHLYAMTRGGVLSNITPAGFTPGRADAVSVGGFGGGTFGTGIYGAPRPDATNVQDASVWSLDTWGQYLNGVMSDDGIIYQWTLGTGSPAVKVTNSPTAVAIVTTQENILFALGAAGIPRRVEWSDQQDNTDWTPTSTNQAGDFDLQTNGRLMQGVRVSSGTLLLTDLDVHLANYTADQLVYGFNKRGDGCGAISRACAVSVSAVSTAYGAQAVWMGNFGFWLYNGYTLPLACDVWDYVFGDMNTLQKSKITVESNAAFGEITWRYPSGGSTEIDRFVTWNFRENHWAIGSIVRLSGVDAGVASPYPMRVGTDGNVYEHEVGYTYTGSSMPFLEGGPFQLGNGDTVMTASQLVPDDLAAGDVSATFFGKFYPDDSEVQYGPYTLSSHTDLRFTARQLRVRYDGVNPADWRIGNNRLDVQAGGAR